MFKKCMNFGAVILLMVSLSISQVGLTDVFAQGGSFSGGGGGSNAGRAMSSVAAKSAPIAVAKAATTPTSQTTTVTTAPKGFADTSIAGKTQAAQIQTDKAIVAKQSIGKTTGNGAADVKTPPIVTGAAAGGTTGVAVDGTTGVAVGGTTVTNVTNVYRAPQQTVVVRHWYERTPFYHPAPVIIVGSSYGDSGYPVSSPSYHSTSGWSIFLYFLLAACVIALVISIIRRQ